MSACNKPVLCLRYDLFLLMYALYSAHVCTTYLVIVSKICLVFVDVLYQVLTSEKVDHIFSKSKLFIKTISLFRIMG